MTISPVILAIAFFISISAGAQESTDCVGAYDDNGTRVARSRRNGASQAQGSEAAQRIAPESPFFTFPSRAGLTIAGLSRSSVQNGVDVDDEIVSVLLFELGPVVVDQIVSRPNLKETVPFRRVRF
jgi:hypothetical protein